MALDLFRKSPRGSVGLDLDGGYMAAVELSGRSLVRAVSRELPAGLIVEGEVRNSAGLSEALSGFFSDNALPRNVRLGVANQQLAVRTLELPPIKDPAERAAAVRFLAAEAIAMPLDETVLDHQVVGEVTQSDGSVRWRVVVVAARRAMVDGLVGAVRSAGLRPLGIDLNAFALVRMLGQSSADTASATVYCHLGEVVNLAVAVGSTCLFARPLAPVRNGDGAPQAAALAEDIRLSIDFFMAHDEARPVQRVLLSGHDAGHEGLADQIASLVGLPTEVAQPLPNVDAARVPAGEDPSRLTVAAGLALGAAA
jgi:type IV pilus assembly protein PilM